METTTLTEIDGEAPDHLEMMSEFVSLVCITALALGFGDKSYGETFKHISYGRALVLVLYGSSWAFCFTSVILVSTNNNNIISCTLGMMTCDVFYAGSKIVGYAWLMERVYLVTNTKTKRLQSGTYRFHLLLLCPYVVILALMLSFKNIYLTEDGRCFFGLQYIASIPLMIYDFILNLYLTFLFVRPLTNVGMNNSRMDWKKSRLYRLARRTLVASVVCLLVSFFNVLAVVITHGNERGLVCLTMCTVDVTVNVMTVHWVTNNSKSKTKDQGGTTRMMKTGHATADVNTAEMTFEEQDKTFIDKKIKLPHIHEEQEGDITGAGKY